MNNNQTMKENMTEFYQTIMRRLIQAPEADPTQVLAQWKDIHQLYLEITNDLLEQYLQSQDVASQAGDVQEIAANQVIIEVTDQNTGKTYRRLLPLEYLETDNGIRLSGDTLEGVPSHLAFLSDTAVLRMKDILGQGPDVHHCHD